MKKLILILLLLPSLVWAQAIDFTKPYAKMGVIQMGATVPATGECTGYLVCQNFEDTSGECTTCDEDNGETWSAQNASGTNLDYTTSPIRGSQSANITGAYWVASPTFAEQTTLWVFLKIRVADGNPAADITIFGIETSAPVTQGYVVLKTTGALSLFNGVGSANTSALFADGASENWCMWINWVKGAGTGNGTAAIYAELCSTACTAGTCTRPETAAATLTNGTWDSADANVVRFWFYGAQVQAGDQVLIKATEISSVPD